MERQIDANVLEIVNPNAFQFDRLHAFQHSDFGRAVTGAKGDSVFLRRMRACCSNIGNRREHQALACGLDICTKLP